MRTNLCGRAACAVPGIAAAALLLAALTLSAQAHMAPSGWMYDVACCSGIDCRQIPASAIRQNSAGYVIRATGELIPFGDRRIRNSKDQYYHWCSIGGRPDTKTVCLYRPAAEF